MIIRRTHKLTTGLVFAALAALPMLTMNACTQATDDTGASSSAVGGGSTDEAGRPRGMLLLADVVDGTGTHALVPFMLPAPPPPKEGAAPPADDGSMKPPPCIVHRTTEGEAAMLPPPPPPGMDGAKDGAPVPPPEGGDAPKDAKPGPVLLQIAVFATEADAAAGPPKAGETPVRPVVVVQCFAAPGEKRVDVPKALLDDAFAGLGDGATARIALAGFPMPPPPPAKADGTSASPPAPPSGTAGEAPKGPPPPMGRGVFGIAKLSDTSKMNALLTTLTLP